MAQSPKREFEALNVSGTVVYDYNFHRNKFKVGELIENEICFKYSPIINLVFLDFNFDTL